jgi:hypothetical protein
MNTGASLSHVDEWYIRAMAGTQERFALAKVLGFASCRRSPLHCNGGTVTNHAPLWALFQWRPSRIYRYYLSLARGLPLVLRVGNSHRWMPWRNLGSCWFSETASSYCLSPLRQGNLALQIFRIGSAQPTGQATGTVSDSVTHQTADSPVFQIGIREVRARGYMHGVINSLFNRQIIFRGPGR